MSHSDHIDPDRIALGIRQPWTELILQGIKTLEIRSTHTRRIETIYIYASKKFSPHPAARRAVNRYQLDQEQLAQGQIVGTVDIVGSRPATKADAEAACVPAKLLSGRYAWELANSVRFERPLEIRFQPYGVWFYPFKRKGK
jgi:hypothetical protein